MLVDHGARRNIGRNARLLAPAILYLSALAWGLLQTWPALPSSWSHPFWALVPGAEATVSATPVSGGHGVLRLASYAMIFWIAIQASMNAKRAQRFLGLFRAVVDGAGAFRALRRSFRQQTRSLLDQASSNVSASFINRNSYATLRSHGPGHEPRPLPSTSCGPVKRRAGRAAAPCAGSWNASSRWRGSFSLGAILCLSALLLTASRAGVASGLAAAIILFVMMRRDSGSSTIVWLLAAVLLGAFLTVLSENVLTPGAAADE